MNDNDIYLGDAITFGPKKLIEKNVNYPFGEPIEDNAVLMEMAKENTPFLNNPNLNLSNFLKGKIGKYNLTPVWSITEVGKMQRNLYNVVVLKHSDGEILLDKKVVADSSPHALTKCNINETLKKNALELHEVEECIICLGQMRDVQEVKTDNIKF